MWSSRLQLGANKTELIWCATQRLLSLLLIILRSESTIMLVHFDRSAHQPIFPIASFRRTLHAHAGDSDVGLLSAIFNAQFLPTFRWLHSGCWRLVDVFNNVSLFGHASLLDTVGDRIFPVAGANLWNVLPESWQTYLNWLDFSLISLCGVNSRRFCFAHSNLTFAAISAIKLQSQNTTASTLTARCSHFWDTL